MPPLLRKRTVPAATLTYNRQKCQHQADDIRVNTLGALHRRSIVRPSHTICYRIRALTSNRFSPRSRRVTPARSRRCGKQRRGLSSRSASAPCARTALTRAMMRALTKLPSFAAHRQSARVARPCDAQRLPRHPPRARVASPRGDAVRRACAGRSGLRRPRRHGHQPTRAIGADRTSAAPPARVPVLRCRVTRASPFTGSCSHVRDRREVARSNATRSPMRSLMRCCACSARGASTC
jgi:hypothetical protein